MWSNKTKRIILYLFTIISILFIYQSVTYLFKVNSFDDKAVVNNINLLASDNYQGRLAGTIENKAAAAYIKNQFINNNLTTFKDSYYDNFTTFYPEKMSGSPYLRVTTSAGALIKEYSYGKDYKEDMINFKGNSVVFGKDKLSDLNSPLLKCTENGVNYVFYTPTDGDINFRSSFIYDSSIGMCVFLTKDALADLKANLLKGYQISCFIPYTVKPTELSNVIGVIKGKDKSAPPLILSAHFDHVGTDLSGNIYHGALDNASGISFVLELSKYIEKIGTPDEDVIIVAFNAEEFGCLGSKNFVDKYGKELQKSTLFNFDMVGSYYPTQLSVLGGKNDNLNTPLVKLTTDIFKKENIKPGVIFEDASDHEYFRKANIQAITLCDNDMGRIHTLKDTTDNIDIRGIERCFNVISGEILHYAYGNNIFVFYSDKILIFSSVGLFIFVTILIKDKIKKDEKKL